MYRLWVLLWITTLVVVWTRPVSATISLALLNGESPFFAPVVDGWKHRCGVLGLDCSRNNTAAPAASTSARDCIDQYQAQIKQWIAEGVSGIAVKPCDNAVEEMNQIYQMAAEQGVFISTIDTDTPPDDFPIRAAYVGTDQEFMGATMAKLARQLHPEGGTFCLVGNKQGRTQGFIQELTQHNQRDDWPPWTQVATDPVEYGDPTDPNGYYDLMTRMAELNPTAMIFLKQAPMAAANYTDFVHNNRHRRITLIGTDGSDFQLAYLNTRKVDALVGQLPYEMGAESAQVLFDLLIGRATPNTEINTNLVAYTLIPIELPALDVDENLIGNLKYIGYVCFSIVGFSVLACLFWTARYRSTLIVRAAQPMFLIMVAAGVMIMAGSLIPLTMDDGGIMQPMNRAKQIGICMTVPWLAFSGFTVALSALFSKLYCVHRLFHPLANTNNKKQQQENETPTAAARVTVTDVIAPFVILLSINCLILTLWTVLDPLVYTREENVGTDYWNRVLSTYGACQSEHVAYYLAPLGVFNFCVLAVAGWQAIQLRNIQLEFSEAKYIALAVAGLVQAFFIGIPIVVVVRQQPQAYYVVLTMILFLLSEGLLLLIFLPKYFLQREYGNMSESDQRRLFELRVRQARYPSAAAPGTNSLVAGRSDNKSTITTVSQAATPQAGADDGGGGADAVAAMSNESRTTTASQADMTLEAAAAAAAADQHYEFEESTVVNDESRGGGYRFEESTTVSEAYDPGQRGGRYDSESTAVSESRERYNKESTTVSESRERDSRMYDESTASSQ